MPHHSRLSTLVLDCKVDDLATSTEFWSRALGKPVASPDQDGDGRYAELETAEDEPIILLQKVGHDARVHLDIETDDVEAEAERLVAGGEEDRLHQALVGDGSTQRPSLLRGAAAAQAVRAARQPLGVTTRGESNQPSRLL